MTHHTQIIELDQFGLVENDSPQFEPDKEVVEKNTRPVNPSRYPTNGSERQTGAIQSPIIDAERATSAPQPSATVLQYPTVNTQYQMANVQLLPERNPFRADEPTAAMVKYTPDFRADSLFFDALQQLQQGSWQQAILLLNVLKAKYPGATELDFLTQDATLKAELDNHWGAKVKGRRIGFAPMQMLYRLVPIVIIAVLIVGGFFAYGYVQRVKAATLERQGLQDQAQAAMQAGSYDEAIGLFNQLLILIPGDANALKGREDAEKQLALQKQYKLAVDAMNGGDTALALKYFAEIESKAPGYLDVKALIAKIKGTANVAELFNSAEAAYQGKQWTDAIQKYEGLRQVNSAFKTEVVTPHLIDAYLQAGQQIVMQKPAANSEPTVAKEYFAKVLKLNPTNTTAQSEGDLVKNYLQGANALQEDKLEDGITALRAVYQERAHYLGGVLAEQLYQAYLKLGAAAQQSGNLWYALSLYSAATDLQVADPSAAQKLLQEVTIALTPTATPQPTSAPLPTATPIPPKLSDFKGWILLRSDREGGYYVMRPDGSDQQPAPSDAGEQLNKLYEKEAWSPDGKSQLYVSTPENGSNGANIYKLRVDLPANWRREFAYTDAPGDEYDPVWAPDNKRIAFVGNSTGNDEIWSMNSDGGDLKQLTHNTWEWDKHPAWSPDSQSLLFFSNRSGKRQIWIMNADGSNQRNLSNNQADDWDPIFIK